MSKTVGNFTIKANRKLTEDYFVLDIQSDTDLPQVLPGQFVQVRIDSSKDTFLRRPLSVYDVDYSMARMHLLVKKVGKGTIALSGMKPGEKLNLVYPLGNSFSMPAKGEKALLVGGGVGVAPLYLLGKYLKMQDMEFSFLLGYQSDKHIIEYDKYSSTAKIHLTTDDGSRGVKGIVTQHTCLLEENYDRIYCCGPEPMMKAVAAIAAKRKIDCEVSLENTMACGFGVCLCCVTDTVEGNIASCTEGPVFNSKYLKWQI